MDKYKPTSIIAWQRLIFVLGQKIGTSLRLVRAFFKLSANKLLAWKVLLENNLSQFSYKFLQLEAVIIKPPINFLPPPTKEIIFAELRGYSKAKIFTVSRYLKIGEEAKK